MKTINYVGDFAKVTFHHSLSSQTIPGQCVKVDGKWFAVMDQRDDEFDVLVRKDSSLLKSDKHIIEGPLGRGFGNLDCKNAILVAGGTGIGVMTYLLKYRTMLGLESYVVHFARSALSVIDVTSYDSCKEYVFWNTVSNGGRPDTPIKPLEEKYGTFTSYFDPTETQVFVSGPSSLVEACRSLDYMCNTNF